MFEDEAKWYFLFMIAMIVVWGIVDIVKVTKGDGDAEVIRALGERERQKLELKLEILEKQLALATNSVSQKERINEEH